MARKEPREPPAPPGAGAVELTPALMQELFSREIPPWPESFEGLWQPDPDGPFWDITGETRPHTLIGTDTRGFRHERRWIILRILGSPDRKANDFEPYTFEFQTRALPRVALSVFWDDPTVDMMALGTGGGPPIVFKPEALIITHRDAPDVRGWIFFPDGPNPVIGPATAPSGREPTPEERERIERGIRLFGHFPTTMTARGAPEGSRGRSKYGPHERPRFLISLKAAIGDVLDVLDEQRNPLGRVTKKAVAQVLWGKRGDPDTLSKYLTLFGISFDQVVEMMRHARERRLSRTELFSVPTMDAPKRKP